MRGSSRGFVFHADGRFIARADWLVKIVLHMDSGSGVVVRSAAVTDAPHRDNSGRATGRARAPLTSAGVQATLAVLDLLGGGSPLSLSEISRELGIAKSTLHRICAVLVERGWAVRDAEGRFALGIRALRLGSSSAELPIVTAFRTVAAEFLTRYDETIALAILDGVESLFVALEETSQPVRLVTHVGSKTPAFASASGRVVLASHPPAAVAAMYGGSSSSLRRPAAERRRRAPVDPR